ncbi:STAS domain-containing protein [Naasia sp. SYSU D00948]|uniref:STAS domain-containing protein n=1 Tax=Naasia sp. SYSU D00948 TaxID=2817379 RepID=UPI001B317DF7|nr:STAS domain-containing protein [Naasia sp. SYSU D00948]
MNQNVRHLDDGVAVLSLGGKLNMVSAPAVRESIAGLVAGGSSRVVVNLEGVEFLDSSGLGALISGLKSTRQAGGDLRIAAPGEQVRLVLRLTNMERVLVPFETAEEAFARA